MKNKISIKIKKWIIYLIALLLIFVCLGPIFYIAWNAGKTREEFESSKFAPAEDFLTNVSIYTKTLLDLNILRYLLNSLIVVSVTIILSTIFTSMSGYAFTKLKFPGRNILFWILIGLLAVPSQIFIIPLFVTFANLNLLNNFFALSTVYATLAFAFGTFLMKSFYTKIPDEIIESAKIDGASTFQVYLKIMLPLGKPALVTLGVLNFFSFWNELLMAMLFNQTDKTKLVTPFISLFSARQSLAYDDIKWPLIYVAMLISLMIPFTVYFIFHNRIASGLTAGSIKG